MVVRAGQEFQDLGRVTSILSPPDEDGQNSQVLIYDEKWCIH